MKKFTSGYSVAELIVSMTLFVTVVAISSATTLSVLKNNRLIRERQKVSNALDLVMEEIVRNARVGYAYKEIDGGKGFEFKSDITGATEDYQISYSAASESLNLFRAESLTGGSGLRFTPNNIEVLDFNIEVTGEATGDDIQPGVYISIEAQGKYDGAEPMTYQTYITQRKYDR